MGIINKAIERLNKQQKEAVLEKESKRLLILAGAGSGKTGVLTVRIAYLLSLGVNPDSIFAVTFTNKAANEMKERIFKLSHIENPNNFWCGTFHSSAMKILKSNIIKTDISQNFNIMDSDDQKSLIKKVLTDLMTHESDKIAFEVDSIKEVVKSIQGYINTCKENEFRPENIGSKELLKDMGLPISYHYIYEVYEKHRIVSNSLDFADLILYAVEILRDNDEIRGYYSDKFRHIFVDEFQDTNPIQYRLISLLTSEKSYHTMVGDDDQLIYSWRGASVGNLNKYIDSNGDLVKIIKLEQNYRSTSSILTAANAVISKNPDRISKNLWTSKEGGSNILFIEANNQFDEADKVVKEIKKLINRGVNKGDIAILYRNNFLSNNMEGILTKNRIAYKIIGGLSFWQRKEVKDLMAYLMLVNDSANDISFERAIASPKRGFGNKTIKSLRDYAYNNNKSLFNSLIEMVKNNEIKGKVGAAANEFINLINDLRHSDLSVNRMLNKIVIDTEIEETYRKEGEDKYQERKSNIDELINYSTYYESKDKENRLSEFLQNSVIQSDNEKDRDVDSVTLMTIHAAKGLEYTAVFLIGFEDGIFPSSQSIRLSSVNPLALQEERRLAYVAITRAKKNLFVSFANRRYQNQSVVSRFAFDFPVELLDYVGNEIYGLSPILQKIRKFKSENSNFEYNIGDIFKDELMGEGDILSVDQTPDGDYELLVDFGFLGKVKKIIKK